jgi:ferredoxin
MTSPLVIEIDRDACVGSSVCVALAAGVFRLDAKGVSTVIDPAGAALGEILEAAEGCPTMAIRVRRADTGEPLFPRAAG